MSNTYNIDKLGNVNEGGKTMGLNHLTQALDFLAIPYTVEDVYNSQLEREIPVSITVGYE